MSKRYGPEEQLEHDMFSPPPHNRTATSAAAARSMDSSVSILRQKVYDYIVSTYEIGATREDIEIVLEMNGSTVRPRVLELLRAGKIFEVEGTTRATTSGRQAMILRAAV